MKDLLDRPISGEVRSWIDPNVPWESCNQLVISTIAGVQASPNIQSMHYMNHEGGNAVNTISAKRPRGRPKKLFHPQQEIDQSAQAQMTTVLEDENTWKTTKLLGISASDEDVVINGLRKSKRLIIMEENHR